MELKSRIWLKMNLIKEVYEIRKKYGSSIFRGLASFGLNFFSYLVGTKMPRGPLYVGYDVTFRCNFSCSYCNRWRIKKTGELTTEEAKKMIRDLGRLRPWLLSFNGGEPLLRKDIFELIKEAKSQNILVDINTNGWFLKEKAIELIDSGVDTISVSVEGCNSEIHDSIRKKPGSFKKIVEGIEEIKSLRRDKKPEIKVRATINKSNFKELRDYIKFWEKIVDDVQIQPIHESPSCFFQVPQEMAFSDTDKKCFISFWDNLRKENNFLDLEFYREFPTFFFDKQKLHDKYTCFAGSFFIQIDPYGHVYPCNEYISKIGSVKEKSIIKIWNSKKMRDFRRIMKDGLNKCVCWYNCNGTPNCYLTKVLGRKKPVDKAIKNNSENVDLKSRRTFLK